MLLLYLVHCTKALDKSFVQNKDLLLNHQVTKQMKNFSYYQPAMLPSIFQNSVTFHKQQSFFLLNQRESPICLNVRQIQFIFNFWLQTYLNLSCYNP